MAAAIAAFALAGRLRNIGIEQDIIMLAGAGMFLFVRYGIGSYLKKITSHRGMYHSIPAAIFVGQVFFFLMTGSVVERAFKAFSITAGYLSHLILDEICSIDSTGRELRFKKSFGTALKFYDPKRLPATLALYALVVFMGSAMIRNPEIVEEIADVEPAQAAPMTPRGRNARTYTPPSVTMQEVAPHQNNPASAYRRERRLKIQQEADEFLAQKESGRSAPQANQPPTNQALSNQAIGNSIVLGNDRRYSDHHIFTRPRQNPNETPSIKQNEAYQPPPIPTSSAMASSNAGSVAYLPSVPSYRLTTLNNSGIDIPQEQTPLPSYQANPVPSIPTSAIPTQNTASQYTPPTGFAIPSDPPNVQPQALPFRL